MAKRASSCCAAPFSSATTSSTIGAGERGAEGRGAGACGRERGEGAERRAKSRSLEKSLKNSEREKEKERERERGKEMKEMKEKGIYRERVEESSVWTDVYEISEREKDKGEEREERGNESDSNAKANAFFALSETSNSRVMVEHAHSAFTHTDIRVAGR